MFRFLAIAATIVAGAACGSAGAGAPTGGNVPVAQPPGTGSGGPPNAYIEAGSPGRWMFHGSGCWVTGNVGGCIDTVPPAAMKGLPVVRVRPGSAVRIHLGFDPSSARLTIGGRRIGVPSGRTVVFTVTREGVVDLVANHGSSDAEYLARVSLSG